MPFKKKSFVAPQYFPSEGRKWLCTWNGKHVYLGPWDGVSKVPPPVVLEKYMRMIPQWQMEFQAKELGIAPPRDDCYYTIAECAVKWLHCLETTPPEEGCLREDGVLNSRFATSKQVLRPLLAMYGSELATKFAAKELNLWKLAVVKGSWHTTDSSATLLRQGRKLGWGFQYVNEGLYTVRRFFGWLEMNGFVPEGKLHSLAAVKSLQVGKKKPARHFIKPEDWEIVLAHTSPTVRAFMICERESAARPGELCDLRPCDIDMSQSIWVVKKTDHKTARFGLERSLCFGKKSQAALKPLLETRDEDEYLFSPREVAEWWRVHRSEIGPRKPAKNKIYPSDLKQRAKRKLQSRRRLNKRRFNPHYSSGAIRQAINHAVHKALGFGIKVVRFTPYDVRATRATEIERANGATGLAKAAAVLGHEHVNTTRGYALERHLTSMQIAAESMED